jgi:hypothetical protein
MTAGIVLAGAPSSGVIHAVAPSVYREVATGFSTCCSGSYQGAFERLEPDDAKVSSPVPRGPGGSNAPWLPDQQKSLRPDSKGD